MGQNIIWTNDGMIHWSIYVALSLDELATKWSNTVHYYIITWWILFTKGQ